MGDDAKTLRRRRAVWRRLDALYPDATCALTHANAFELLLATILSAQCTDRLVNRVTPALFARYPDAHALAAADGAELESLVRQVNFFRTKAKNLRATAAMLCARHGGDVPATVAELIALPGVARKTANVVLGVCFGRAEGFVVDTHVARLSQRLGWTQATRAEAIERDLMASVPQKRWIQLAHQLILHGRKICLARQPRCDACALRQLCPSGAASMVTATARTDRQKKPGQKQSKRLSPSDPPAPTAKAKRAAR